MSSAYTPTVDDFREVWAAFNGYGGLVARPHSVSMDEGYAEFDRFIARIKAEAWGEGAYVASLRWMGRPEEMPKMNPHRTTKEN